MKSKDASDRFEQLLDFAPDAIVGVDRDGRIVLANAQTETLFGYARAELVGELVELLVPERFRGVHPGHRDGYFADPRMRPMGADLELFGRRRDGSEFTAEISLSSLETEQGILGLAAVRDVTERHEAEQAKDALRALQESSATLQAMLDNTTAVIYIKDLDGRYTLINRQFERLFGVTREQVQDRTDDELFPAESAEAFGANDAEVVEEGTAISSEETVRHEDGDHSYVSVKFPLFGPDGKPFASGGISTDITARKRAEDEVRRLNADLARRVEDLKEREQRFRQLVEQLPAIVYMWEAGADGQCYYVSPAIESVLGYTVEDWLADPKLWANRLHPEDHDWVSALELSRRQSGEDFAAEYRMFARDGRLVWIRDEAIMVRREDGEPDHLQGLMQDVSAEKGVQASLRRSREETIRRLSRAAEFRDDETGMHIERVSQFCELIGTRLGLDPKRCEQLRIASPMHDVGKIGIPDAVLLKPGPLDDEERAEMERHSEIGYRILAGSGAELLDLAATIALTHHERFDGDGYPRGLEGEEIPLEGRIAAVADVFDALTNDRVYRPAYSYAQAVAIMEGERGAHFDPRVLDVFLEAGPEISAIMKFDRDQSVGAGIGSDRGT